MLSELIKIEIDGKELDDVYDELSSVEVELDDELPGMFRFQLPLLQQEDGSWRFLDDQRFRPWRKVVISAGLDGDATEVMNGRITHVRPAFESDLAQCVLDVWGLDGSALLDRVDRLRDWPNKKDSDIAAEIFGEYGLSATIDDTDVIHGDVVSTIIQRETDWQFLNRLARRNGFDCFVEGGSGYFRRHRLDTDPQALLAVHFGDETNVDRFSVEVDALTPTNVSIYQLDRETREILGVTIETSGERRLGALAPVVPAGVRPGLVVVGQTMTTGSAEMTNLSRGLYEHQQWFVTGQGEIAANESGVILRPRGTVTIKGIGETFSGVYLVSHVTHSFSADGYVQHFEVKRNALAPNGSEDFGGGAAGLLGGLL